MKSITRHYFLQLLSLIVFFGLSSYSSEARAVNLNESSENIPEQINDFKTCALVSLQRVPQLQRSKMEIDIRRLDEDDSRWSYVPALHLSSYYYISEDEANISFGATNFKPWEPYYNLQARKHITQIVILNHIQAITQSLNKLADTFLQLIAFSEIDNYYSEIYGLYQKRIQYFEKRQKSDVTTPVELEIEKRTLAYLRMEHSANSLKREALIKGLCIAMNLPDPEIFALDESMVLKQILGPDETIKGEGIQQSEYSINQKIMVQRQLLQEKKILLAYSKFMPDFSLGVRSPDVLNVSIDSQNDYFFYVGMNLKLWDGNKRSRDITRQEMILRQMEFEKREIENKDALEWLEATQKLSFAASEHELSQSVDELNQLQMKKKKFNYNKGAVRFPVLLDHEISIYRDKINRTHKELAYNRAVLKLRYLSGKLLNDNLNISLDEIPYE